MSDQNQGGWQPLPPTGEYDPEATGFLQLPPEGEAPQGPDPLAAPGHGYTPPPIAVAATDPADTGAFQIPDFSQPAGAYHVVSTGTGAPHPADGEGSREQGRIGEWEEVRGANPASPWPEPGAAGPVQGPGGLPEHSEPGGPAEHGEPGFPAGHGDTGGPWQVPADGGRARPGSGHAEEAARWPQPAAPAADGGTTEWTVPEDARAGSEIGTAWSVPAAEDGPDESGEYAVEGAPAPLRTGVPAGDEHTAAPGHPDGPDAAAVEDEAQPGGHPDPAGLPESVALPADDQPRASYVLRVNGADRPVTDAWIGESLLYVLRERLGLAGAKDGCAQGECGACNVKVDGRLVASCLVPAATAAGAEVRTVEGLAQDGHPSDVQRALAAHGSVQCGFCIPGLAMTVHDLLEGNHTPNDAETRQALCGNLCRCTGYQGVLAAVREVIAERQTAAAAAHEDTAEQARIPQQAGPGLGGVHVPPDPVMPPPRQPGPDEETP